MDWQKNPIFIEMGLDALPSGYSLNDFHHSNTSFPFVLGPNPHKNCAPGMQNFLENPYGNHQEQNAVFRGNNINPVAGNFVKPLKKPFMANDSIPKSPKDESWESIQSVTETSVSSTNDSITDTTDDDRALSELRSSDFVSMGDTYSASEESTDTSSLESDATIDSQFHTEASELTDYENTKNTFNVGSSERKTDVPRNKLSKYSSKKIKEVGTVDDFYGDFDDKFINKSKSSSKRNKKLQTSILTHNKTDYYTNSPKLFEELKNSKFLT